MSKIIYDLIQRFEVENGVPRLVSSNIQVIQGGEDLMSLATSLLAQLGFDQIFEKKQASQYVGYRLKNPEKGAKSYQIVLAQRKEELCISIPQEVLESNILQLKYWWHVKEADEVGSLTVGRIWVLPSKKNVFLDSLPPQYWELIQAEEKTVGEVFLNQAESDGYNSFVVPDSQVIPRNEFRIEAISDNSSYLILREDKLFPYTRQVSINSSEVLEEFIVHFAKILMEQQ